MMHGSADFRQRILRLIHRLRMWGSIGEEILPSKKLFAEKGKELFCLAEQVGFEPTGLERLTDFESASL